ncbi:MAG: bifunctional DNA primase/polymerase, partial [Chloroflexi bacterium]|nr:bifunctional DNA primase/polymerase [Chloroflexota bacterium]
MIKQDTALRLAEEGFYVFPLVPDGKIPAFEGWQDAATRAADTICGWWERDPDYNIGIFTEKYGDTGHLVALDVDIKDGKAGAETFRGLRQTHDMPRTRTNLTASGGRHIIYAAHKPVRSSVERVGPGLDVRSAGGYIVGPGSMIRGMEYSSDWAALHYAPEWLIEKCGAPKARNSEVFPAIEETDTDAIIKRAVEWLKGGAPEAIQGRHGDQTTYTVAARLKDFGLSELAAVELLAHHWNEQKAHPTWAYEELAKKVSNAYAYGIEPLGVAAPQADFDEIEIP